METEPGLHTFRSDPTRKAPHDKKLHACHSVSFSPAAWQGLACRPHECALAGAILYHAAGVGMAGSVFIAMTPAAVIPALMTVPLTEIQHPAALCSHPQRLVLC